MEICYVKIKQQQRRVIIHHGPVKQLMFRGTWTLLFKDINL